MPAAAQPQPGASDLAAIAAALREARVGGHFWAARPPLPDGRDLLLVPDHAGQARLLQDRAAAAGDAHRAVLIGPFAGRHGIPSISALCDPWYLAAQAGRIVAGADAEIAAVALLMARPIELVGAGGWSGLTGPTEVAARITRGWQWRDPFNAGCLDPFAAIALLAEWRRLIDRNRLVAAVYGVAAWKRVTADALLWDGREGPRHASPGGRRTAALPQGSRVIAWKSRTAADLPARLAERGIAVGEIEDGFIRSTGLGANCVPPLSIIVDGSGIYFDPAGPSDLEALLATADIPASLCARAAALRARLVAAGIGKYGRDDRPVPIAMPGRRRVLVPGQVADDRSVLSGGAGGGNLELLQRARALEPDAWIIYRPHPDVEAGHRAGHIAEAAIRQWADEIDRSSPIARLIDSVDALHTLTSLAGFEGLMRGKAVTTHGVPFYAGWGLTRDLGPIPSRRGRQRTLDELVAATLILYPRYLDPVTRLPCSPEILVDRLESDRAKVGSSLVMLRELQGRANRLWRRFGGGA